MMKDEVLMG